MATSSSQVLQPLSSVLSDRTGTVLECHKSSEPALLGAIWKFTASHREERRGEGRRERGRERERERGCGTPTAPSRGIPRAVLVSPVVVFKLARLAENTDDHCVLQGFPLRESPEPRTQGGKRALQGYEAGNSESTLCWKEGGVRRGKRTWDGCTIKKGLGRVFMLLVEGYARQPSPSIPL